MSHWCQWHITWLHQLEYQVQPKISMGPSLTCTGTLYMYIDAYNYCTCIYMYVLVYTHVCATYIHVYTLHMYTLHMYMYLDGDEVSLTFIGDGLRQQSLTTARRTIEQHSLGWSHAKLEEFLRMFHWVLYHEEEGE